MFNQSFEKIWDNYAYLQQDLEIEQRNHKSVIDASKGKGHAWYCECQLGGSKGPLTCNCPRKLYDAYQILLEIRSLVNE